eukprot:6251522-Amphidinium_carterae.1
MVFLREQLNNSHQLFKPSTETLRVAMTFKALFARPTPNIFCNDNDNDDNNNNDNNDNNDNS